MIALNILNLLLYKKYQKHLNEICIKGRPGRPYLLGLYLRSLREGDSYIEITMHVASA